MIKIPSDLACFTNKHSSEGINYLTQNKDRILEIISKEEDYMFDVGLFLDNFYNSNSDYFNNLMFEKTNILLLIRYLLHLFCQ
jgi:hypothetical protein